MAIPRIFTDPICDIVTGLNHQHQKARAAVQRLLDLVRAAQHREALCREARHQRRAIDSHNRHGMRPTYQDTEGGGRNALSCWLSTMPFPKIFRNTALGRIPTDSSSLNRAPCLRPMSTVYEVAGGSDDERPPERDRKSGQ